MEKAKECLINYFENQYNDFDEEYFDKYLMELKPIWSSFIEEHRWYYLMLNVIQLDGKYIGYEKIETLGDTEWPDSKINDIYFVRKEPWFKYVKEK